MTNTAKVSWVDGALFVAEQEVRTFHGLIKFLSKHQHED